MSHRFDPSILREYDIRGVVGKEVALVDSAESCAQFLSERLDGTQLLAGTRRRAGVIQPFVTDEVERFDEMAKRFLGVPTDPARKIDLSALRPA